LERLQKQLEQALSFQVASPKAQDMNKNFIPHIAIGKTNNIQTFKRLWKIVKSWESPDMSLYLLRITLIGDVHGDSNIIKCEYDLLLKDLLEKLFKDKWLTRNQALSNYWYRKTMAELRKRLELPEIPLKIQSIWGKLLSFYRKMTGKKTIYLIGDTHFDHANIIETCDRPFSSVAEMDRNIVKNWNQTVKQNDTVYFLGDWSHGRGARSASYWVKRLNGNIVSIRGGHDRFQRGIYLNRSKVLTVGNHTFLLIHDPDERRANWRGWIIHGHHHNNNLRDYPFINGERKTINVSAELMNYAPVSIDYLLSLDLDSIKRMRTINDQPERK
jgi:calcineurin-like phosphoesterase family protein